MIPLKKDNINTYYYNVLYPPNNTSQHRFVLKYRQSGTTLSYGISNIKKQIEKYTENVSQNAYIIPQHFMCDFLIILRIVSLSVGLTFTPCIGYTTICYALRTRSYCTHEK